MAFAGVVALCAGGRVRVAVSKGVDDLEGEDVSGVEGYRDGRGADEEGNREQFDGV